MHLVTPSSDIPKERKKLKIKKIYCIAQAKYFASALQTSMCRRYELDLGRCQELESEVLEQLFCGNAGITLHWLRWKETVLPGILEPLSHLFNLSVINVARSSHLTGTMDSMEKINHWLGCKAHNPSLYGTRESLRKWKSCKCSICGKWA